MSSISRMPMISALMDATILASPLIVMAADSATPLPPRPAQATMAKSEAAAPTPEATRETIEQQINPLHGSLKITPARETGWNGVAKASAKERHGDHRGGERHDHERGRGGGYYGAPSVVYGNTGYYPPPMVYGPGVGIVLPGASIGIR